MAGGNLGIASAAVVDAGPGSRSRRHEMGEVVIRDPFGNGARRKHGGLAVNVLESDSHSGPWYIQGAAAAQESFAIRTRFLRLERSPTGC